MTPVELILFLLALPLIIFAMLLSIQLVLLLFALVASAIVRLIYILTGRS